MRLGFRLAGLGLLALGAALWFFGGPNLGWTKTTVPVEQIEEVTKLKQITWEKRFVPGVDFLGATVLLAGACGGLSFFFPKK
jgi:hypothetical protein